MILPFTKMNGAGNDFVVLDPRCAENMAGEVSSAVFVVAASRKQINPGRRAKLQLYVRR